MALKTFKPVTPGLRQLVIVDRGELYRGKPVKALCGKKWVPSRDPKRYPVCPTCRERKAAGWTI